MSRTMYRGNSSNIRITTSEITELEGAVRSLQSNGMDNLSSSISGVQGMFSSLGVELGSLPNRLLSVGGAMISLMNSTSKLKNLDVKNRITESFSKGWTDAGNQADAFGRKLKNLGSSTKDMFKNLGSNINTVKGLITKKVTALKAKGGIKSLLIGKTGLLTIAKVKLQKAMKGVLALLHPKKLALGLLKIVKLGFKGVLLALNIVKGIFIALWKLSPFGMIAGAVALAGAAIAGLVRWFNRGTDAGAAFTAENERTTEAMDSLNNSIESNRRAHEDNIRSAEVSNRVNGDLIQSLKNLNTETELSVAERARVRDTVDQLNNSIEGLNLVIDEETGLLTESSQQLLEQAKLYNDVNRARAESETIMERLNQAREEEATKAIELIDLAERRSEIETNEDLNRRERRRLLRELDDLEQEIIETKEELTEEIVRLGEAHYETYTAMSQTTAQFVQEQAFAYENLSDAQRAVVDKLVDRWTMYRDQSREMFSQVSQETRLWAYETDEYGNQVRVSLLEVGDTHENVMQTMIDNMRANREATAQWSDNLDLLAYRTSEEFAQHMREMGIGSAAYVAAMLSDCHNLLYELAAEFEMGGYAATDNISRTLGEGGEELAGMVDEIGRNLGTTLSQSIVDADFESIGMMLPAGLTRGVEDGTGETVEAVSNMSTSMQEAFQSLNQINSPSGLYMKYGANIVEGLCSGIKRLKSQAVSAIEMVARDMKRTYNNVDRTYQNFGRDIMNGLNQGLINGENTVISTARRIANNISSTMQRALQINSPSRVMREKIGRFIPEGIAVGIDKYADAAIGSVDKLAKDIININIPSVESMIGIGPSMRLAGAGGSGNVTHVANDNKVNYAGLFDGATINWHNQEDIRRTMEKIAWATEREKARLW